MLAREQPQDYREEWTRRIGQDPARQGAGSEARQSWLIFRLFDEWFGLPSGFVREISGPLHPHTLPHRDLPVLGLVSLRGELLVCVSLAHALEVTSLEARESGAAALRHVWSRTIIAQCPQGPLALPVHEVSGFTSCTSAQLREVPSTLAGARATFSTALLPMHDRMVGCLDGGRLLEVISNQLT